MEQTLYEKIGGQEAVAAAVDVFYQKVLSDERIKHFFDDVDMTIQFQKQKRFLTYAFGGPHKYTGLKMKEAHARLLEKGLDASHVDAVIELLGATLKQLKVAPELIKEVADIAESVRDEVLGRK